MTGYPYSVSKFFQAHNDTSLVDRRWIRVRAPGVGSLSIAGARDVLPNGAVATNNQHMLETLCFISKRPCYKRDWRLSFSSVLSTAIRYTNVEMLECVRKLKRGEPPDRRWEPNLVRLTTQRVDPSSSGFSSTCPGKTSTQCC
ncbi:hypothetical protein Gpo141_00010033 [Globisporangium polare]